MNLIDKRGDDKITEYDNEDWELRTQTVKAVSFLLERGRKWNRLAESWIIETHTDKPIVYRLESSWRGQLCHFCLTLKAH